MLKCKWKRNNSNHLNLVRKHWYGLIVKDINGGDFYIYILEHKPSEYRIEGRRKTVEEAKIAIETEVLDKIGNDKWLS